MGENGVKKWSLREGRGQKHQEQVQRKKRADICLPWKVGGEQRWGKALEEPALPRRGVSALIKEKGCLLITRRAPCQAGSLGDRTLWPGDKPGSWHQQRQPRGKGGIVELGLQTWLEPLIGQML